DGSRGPWRESSPINLRLPDGPGQCSMAVPDGLGAAVPPRAKPRLGGPVPTTANTVAALSVSPAWGRLHAPLALTDMPQRRPGLLALRVTGRLIARSGQPHLAPSPPHPAARGGRSRVPLATASRRSRPGSMRPDLPGPAARSTGPAGPAL